MARIVEVPAEETLEGAFNRRGDYGPLSICPRTNGQGLLPARHGASHRTSAS